MVANSAPPWVGWVTSVGTARVRLEASSASGGALITGAGSSVSTRNQRDFPGPIHGIISRIAGKHRRFHCEQSGTGA